MLVLYLIYISSGMANAELQGKLIVQCEPGAMIEEITFMTGAPASATVLAYSPIRSLTFETSKLRRFLQRNPDIRAALEQNIANHLREKLVTTSKAG
jgi:CRP-like cAMP-binding protein